MRLNNDLSKIMSRKAEQSDEIINSVRGILSDVKTRGDKAVREYAKELDGFVDENIFVSREEMEAAVIKVGDDFTKILKRAYENIKEFHSNQVEKSWSTFSENGVIMGQILRPLQRVALYIPGGTASYPSTVLMNAIPAKLAEVKDIVIFTPAKADGKVSDAILAAAACCGIYTVCKIGGAHGVAAMGYGTETIKKVDKIVGPGNAYVAAAKRLMYGEVSIDMIAGPSDILVIADETANPKYIAADMMSQAEHDEMASAVLITTSEQIIRETEREISKQIEGLSRKDIIKTSLENYGAAVLVDSIEKAFELSNEIAPEHLEILTKNPFENLSLVENAGSIFLGEYTPEPLGDYMSGTNHVLPTGGTAKFYSPLGVYDFTKWSAYSYYPRNALSDLKDDVIKFSEVEGFTAHANSVKVRFEE